MGAVKRSSGGIQTTTGYQGTQSIQSPGVAGTNLNPAVAQPGSPIALMAANFEEPHSTQSPSTSAQPRSYPYRPARRSGPNEHQPSADGHPAANRDLERCALYRHPAVRA